VADQARLFDSPGPLCNGCPLREPCGAIYSKKACLLKWGTRKLGGRQVLHPSFAITYDYLAAVDGPEFDRVVARPLAVPELPSYVAQLRMRRALRGELRQGTYAITAGQVVGKRRRPLSAAEVRRCVGLAEDQRLILLLFGKDAFLEHLWNNARTFLPELASAGFDLIAAPSYSAWEPRPRPEHMYAAKRSLLVFEQLQKLGANAIPRLTWTVPHDARRLAEWVERNPCVTHVSLDLTTYRSSASFHEQLELLGTFDRLTGSRLTYLVNGPSNLDRVLDLYATVSVDRVHITNSRAIARDSAPGTSFADKETTEREVVQAAQRVARAAHGQVQLAVDPLSEAREGVTSASNSAGADGTIRS
jgi:hypothetical protein